METKQNNEALQEVEYSLSYLNLQLIDNQMVNSLNSNQLIIIENLLQLLNSQSQTIELEKMRNWAEQGIPEECIGIRALVWKILLGYLGTDKRKWNSTLKERRQTYNLFLDDFLDSVEVPPQSIIDAYEAAEQLRFESNLSNLMSTQPESQPAKDLQNQQQSNAVLNSQESQTENNSQNTADEQDFSQWKRYFSDSDIFVQIEKDTDRTRNEIEFFSSLTKRELRVEIPFDTFARAQRKKKSPTNRCEERHSDVLTRILFLYAKLNSAVQYVQGMNEIVAVIYFAFYEETKCNSFYAEDGFIQVEADTFFCFVKLMALMKDRFMRQMDEFKTGLRYKCLEFKQYLSEYDPKLSTHFDQLAIDPQFYCLRWLLLLFSQEFSLNVVMRLWDTLLSKEDLLMYLNFIGLAVLETKRQELLHQDFPVVMTRILRIETLNIDFLLTTAAKIHAKKTDSQIVM